MLRIIIFGFVFLLLIFWDLSKRRQAARSASEPKIKPMKNPPGKKYAWTWMQAAGALKLQFVRPEENNGWPAIRGSVNRVGISVQCVPPKDGGNAATLISFRFEEPAKIGLLLMLSRSKEELRAFARGRESLSFREHMPGRVIPDSFFLCSDLVCFENHFTDEHRDHLTRLSLIYPSVLLTGTKISVRTDGVSTDPMGFQMQLRTLLSIAQSFNQFAWNCAHAEEEIPPEPEPVPTSKDHPPAPPEPAAAETPHPKETELPAEPEKTPVPEPAQPEITPVPEAAATAAVPEQNAFVAMLWAKGLTSLQQKELFAPYAGLEAEWTGVLKTSYAYSADFVFGREGGVKTTFDLGEFKPEGSFLSFRIKAVVSFPKEAADQLKQAAGKTFRFRGKLLKIEPIAKEIYLSGGDLIGAEA